MSPISIKISLLSILNEALLNVADWLMFLAG